VLLDVKDTEGGDSQQFRDPEYRKRRDAIAALGKTHRIGEIIPTVSYSKEENDVWVYCYEKLRKLHRTCMSRRYEKQMEKIERHFDFHKKIPQLKDLESYLQAETGFRIRPTHGILSQREFLNAFAHRVFCSTQYIRHPSNP
jgi:phenylalanine-4-hydroxylase